MCIVYVETNSSSVEDDCMFLVNSRSVQEIVYSKTQTDRKTESVFFHCASRILLFIFFLRLLNLSVETNHPLVD